MQIEALQKQTGLPISVLLRIADTASRRYKTYTIPKRNGQPRLISHPSRELKAIQRWLNKRVFRHFPVHECATAYAPGCGIRENAVRHASTAYTLRMDFKNFFPSFDVSGISNFLALESERRNIALSEQDIRFISLIVTRHGCLTIGAPSSPILTNAMMHGFDEELNHISKQRGLIYTRYADDIFLSSFERGCLEEMAVIVRKLADAQKFMRLKISDEKTARLSKKYRRSITGLVITPDKKVSLGRERKRTIKSLVHRFNTSGLDEDGLAYLGGIIAFACDVEPSFYENLVKKYGADLMARIQKPHLEEEDGD